MPRNACKLWLYSSLKVKSYELIPSILCFRPFNAKLPLEMAKRTVEKDYAVVGTWEDTNVTLTVLENYVPRYFKGATKMYYSK